MKDLIKLLWVPIVTAILIIGILICLRVFPGLLIAIFEGSWISDCLIYVWYELYISTIVGATAVIIKTAGKMQGKYKVIYFLISFLIISNAYYGAGSYGLFVNF